MLKNQIRDEDRLDETFLPNAPKPDPTINPDSLEMEEIKLPSKVPHHPSRNRNPTDYRDG